MSVNGGAGAAVIVDNLSQTFLVGNALLNGTDRAKNMEVWVWYASVLSVRLVYGEVNHHAPAHKLLDVYKRQHHSSPVV